MEKRYQHTVNGQSVLQDDLNVLGEASALADDRVLAELFRLTPYDGVTTSRGVIPYSGSTALVAPNGASGSVLVNPFRAIIGSRTAVGTDAKKNWRDIRSTVSVGTTTLAQSLSLAANASGNPRWDLIYAQVLVDANSASVTRKVKNPTTKAIAGALLVTTLETTVTVGVVTGTPGASPAFPATPADSGNTYYIPLAYVRVINGFGGASTVLARDVDEIASVLLLSRATGASTLRPADQSNVPGGTAISGSGTSAVGLNGANAWNGTTNTRPGCYMPPSLSGGESLLIALDFTSASSVNWSHQSGAIVDASRDWRNRIFKWLASVNNVGSFPWKNIGAGVPNLFSPNAGFGGVQVGYTSGSGNGALAVGLGHSFYTSSASGVLVLSASGAAATATPAVGHNLPTNTMVSSTQINLGVDSSGRLTVTVTGVPLCSALIWLDASAPFANP